MSAARTAGLVADALGAIEAIGDFLAGAELDRYLADRMLRAAVERQFIIGEALGVLRRLDPATAELIPDLAEAVRFRNVLVHGYAIVTDDRVWATAVDHLPALRTSLRAVLARLDDA
jgi:uncharacterized protein with HEPN domain